MSFISWQFIIFVLISLLFYYILPKKVQWIFLLIVSYTFYSFCGISAFVYLLFATVVTYISGIILDKLNKKIESLKRNEDKISKIKRNKKLIVAFTCISNFGLLFIIKYWDFFANIFNNNFNNSLPLFNILLPLGISFYIFQSTGYIIDVYRKKVIAEKNIFKYALFTSFFPQMVQGPISRFKDLSEELFKGHEFSFENFELGIQLMLWGYFKKLLIADRAAVVVNLVFDKYGNYGGATIIVAGILYCIQLYCDFSGGIDITRGVSRLFGINLTENFKRPIFATSLSDFWRRWHISLGTWMKDYVFYPLSLSKPFIKLGKFIRKHVKGKAGQIIPVSIATFVVYFLIGIWHGASWKYIAFGLWNGLIITTSLLLEPIFSFIRKKLNLSEDSKMLYVFRIFRTSLIVLAGRYITRAANLGTTYQMFKIIVKDFRLTELTNGILLNLGITLKDYIVIVFGTLLMILIEWLQENKINVSEKFKKMPIVLQFIFTTSFLIIITIFGIYKGDYIASEFIYKQF